MIAATMRASILTILVCLLLACGSSKRAEPENHTEIQTEAMIPSPEETIAPPQQNKSADKQTAAGTAPPASNKKPTLTASKPERLDRDEAEAFKAYKRSLARGRKLSNKGKHAEAIPHFKAALAYMPDDPATNSELGWSAMKTGDLKLAKSATAAALKRPQKKQLQAASLYNLGRIYEQMNDSTAAQNAYTRSLAVRPNKIVQKRLASLQGASEAAKSLVSLGMIGPHPSLEALCKHLKTSDIDDYFGQLIDHEDEKDFSCEPIDEHDTNTVLKLAHPHAPFMQAHVVSFGTGWDGKCELVVQTGSGWYTTRGFLYCGGSSEGGWVPGLRLLESGEIVILEARLIQSMSYRDTYTDEDGEDWRYSWSSYESGVVYCAVGDDPRPVCTPQLAVGGWEYGQVDDDGNFVEDDPDTDEEMKALKTRIDDKGTLLISGAHNPFDDAEQVLAGKYRLLFKE